MRAEDVTKLWDHWEVRRAAKQKLIIFRAGKLGDMSKASLENAISYQGNKTMDHKETQDEDLDPIISAKPSLPKSTTKASASTRPTARTMRPADHDSSEDELAATASARRTAGPAARPSAPKVSASTRPTSRTMRPADSDSSEEDPAAEASVGCTGGPAARPSSIQEGAPAAVPIKERVRFLKSLSNLAGYLLLVEGIKDLKKVGRH